MKWAAACVLFGLCTIFVRRSSSVEDQASGLREELSLSAVHGGADRLKTGDWRGARYTGRRSLNGDHYVIVQQDSSTPSPPPPSKVIIKKSSTPSPPPPSKVIIKKSSPCPSPPPPSSQVIKVVKSSSSMPSPPPPSKKVFGNLKFPFFP